MDAGDVASVVVAVAAAATAFFAWFGLNTWRRQLKGQAQWDLARSALRATYKVRYALSSVRSPFMSAGEQNAAVLELDPKVQDVDPASSDAQARSQAAAYQVRWREVESALSELDLVRIEAEAMWGAEAADVFDPLRKHARELNVAVLVYLRSYKRGNRTPRQLDQDERNERILWEQGAMAMSLGARFSPPSRLSKATIGPKLK